MNISREEITKKNKLYHDRIASVYDLSKERNHPKVKQLYREIFDNVFVYFQNLGGTRKLDILDIGCGTGGMEEFLKPSFNNILGIDVSEEMLKIARKKYPNVVYKNADVYTFKTYRKYDLIVGNAVLHHFKDYEFCIKRTMELLKQNGCIYFGYEPNYFVYSYFSSAIGIFRKFIPDKRVIDRDTKQNLEHFAEYHVNFSNGINPFKLEKKFKKNGFKKVSIKFSNREFIASLADRVNLKAIDYLPNCLLDMSGVLSRSFYLTAFK